MSDKNSKPVYFYPGSANDLVPAILPALRCNIVSDASQFIYCDPAVQVETFFKQFEYRIGDPLSLKDIANMNPQYRGFIRSLDIQSISVEEYDEIKEKKKNCIKILLNIDGSDDLSFRSEINFFPVTAEEYLDHIHENIFHDTVIETLLHVTQITEESGKGDYFFSPKTFLNLVMNHPLLKDLQYIVTDNPSLYSETDYSEISDKIFAGWGKAGDSMVHSGSSRILRKQMQAEGKRVQKKTKLDRIRSKLEEFRFE